ncbi:MAG TPA: CGNR zinc finger domain-containing protein [Nocardioides sp.]|uniref:CGNR zinc finger domain-containing protein n=1 Tax=Nocardioides sp. TaxID=35761 RepID=UPI002E348BC4|nr:CGNR zinc finger domain-containing protein [Nocardioides sp.]HEX5089249.1 CGNR zinc finger domain-containing protein [Nocardioides sp.]
MSPFRSGNGAAWLDLLSTLEGRYRAQQFNTIGTTGQLRAWLRANDLEPRAAVTVADVERVAEARECLHRLAVARIEDCTPAAADVRLLNRLLDGDQGLRVTGPDLRPRRPVNVDDALARLARQAVVDLSGHGAGTLRACGDDTCSSIFLDTTGRRRWCTDLSCGNRARVRAHRRRESGPAAQAPGSRGTSSSPLRRR